LFRLRVPHESHGPGHVRGGHRRAAIRPVLPVRQRAVDANARSGDVHRRAAEVGEARQVVGAVGRRDGYDVVPGVVGRVERAGVVVRPVVAGGGDAGAPGGRGLVDGGGGGGSSPAAAVTVVDDLGPASDRVVQGADGVAHVPAARGVEELEGHELCVPVDPGDADPVVADGPDRPGDVGAVAVVVHRVRVIVGEVVPVDVVAVAVAVVVDAIARDLARVGPDVRGQVRVVVVDAGVNHGDDGVAGAGAGVPGLRGVDVGVGDAAVGAGVVEPPEVVEARVVRGAGDGDAVVRLDKRHAGPTPEESHCLRHRDVRVQSDAEDAATQCDGFAGYWAGVGVTIVPLHEDVRRVVGGMLDGELPEVGEGGDFAGFERIHGESGGAAATGASHSESSSRCRSRC